MSGATRSGLIWLYGPWSRVSERHAGLPGVEPWAGMAQPEPRR